MTQPVYYLGRLPLSVLDAKRKHTTLQSIHQDAQIAGDIPHPFLWDGYVDIERHYPETIEDVLEDVPHEYAKKAFFVDAHSETFYIQFGFRSLFTSKEGFEAFVKANEQSGMDVSDYEVEMKKTDWETQAIILYTF